MHSLPLDFAYVDLTECRAKLSRCLLSFQNDPRSALSSAGQPDWTRLSVLMTKGTLVHVAEGTANEETFFVQSADDPITIQAMKDLRERG